MENREKIIENYIAGYNNFDTDRMVTDFCHDIVFENISGGETSLRLIGLQAFKDQAEQAKTYFYSRKQTITSYLHQQDETMITIEYTAVLAMDFPNGLKKGDELNLKGTSVFKFSGDKIISLTDIS